ncbi:GntR family transcriptional regulator [Alishewanella aestuarii B11]|uniref:GntR family transcriptional regulator n=1 Tax=Alishewanella aestuarii B11 TaxID=1197174 RepID=J1QHC7_9ALTE|nr:rhamnogalacturonan acetylesterase [Alishewanella aestuarii]EJI84916.1 GntR family transcriptional regulator [Alishewanella aestuarii B11]
MNRLILCLCLLLSLSFASQSFANNPVPARLHLVGDSTMSVKINPAYPERGWGELLPAFMLSQLTIINHAANGRSTRRFINEGRWQLLLSELSAGDYVLIQFGHNDQKIADPTRYAAPDSDYQAFLRQFVADIRAKNAIPLLASSICRRNFNSDGVLIRDLNAYAEATAQVAAELTVSFFDLQQQSCDFIENAGLAGSQPYFIQIPADLYRKYPDGSTDNTHLTLQGAAKIAQFFVRELKRQQHPLAAYIYRELL